jgi:hypothetical protein
MSKGKRKGVYVRPRYDIIGRVDEKGHLRRCILLGVSMTMQLGLSVQRRRSQQRGNASSTGA